ncbi:putative amidohydrolase [Microbacterium hydrothermale]|nr:putative amidohydrolase [Microbacterium hydrothermale]
MGEAAANLDAVRAAVGDAVRAGARLVVVPELALSGYVFADAAEARSVAILRDDPRWRMIAGELSEGAVAVVGYAEDAGARLFNTAAVLTRDARLGDYRKSHLWGEESRFFASGDAAGTVIETPIGRLGVAICYDNEFPEVPRRLALAGAEVLALPVNWPLVDRPAGERAPETIQAMAAARSSRLATVIADRHGSERGVIWTGGTAIIDEDGWVAGVAVDGGSVVATLRLRHPSDKSLPPLNDLFADRRPELYG